MLEQANGQMELEAWFEQAEAEGEFIIEDPNSQKSNYSKDKEDCKVCGDSGPCSACERGIKLAQQQGRPYRRSR
jgi:hypothetical protein